MIVCVRTVLVPPEWRERYLAWIDAAARSASRHGILAELVCEPADRAADLGTSAVSITAIPQ